MSQLKKYLLALQQDGDLKAPPHLENQQDLIFDIAMENYPRLNLSWIEPEIK